jgi:tetratricopeptide (TPR) repeat protein
MLTIGCRMKILDLKSAIPHPVAFLVALLVAGCGPRAGKPTPAARGELSAGFTAIEGKNADAAMARADAYLSSHRTGPGVAEAHYLRGRAFELRAERDGNNAQQHLQNARSAYVEALKHSPSRNLEALIRSQVGNVAYFQDDYRTAQGQLAYAAQHLENPEDRAWALYRSGIAQQRMGQFAVADRTFDQVQSRYPNTEPAKRAREHRGARNFSVRLATYQDGASANALVAQVRSQGLNAAKTTDAQGRSIVSVVNLPSFDQAKQIKTRYAAQFPDAMVIP